MVTDLFFQLFVHSGKLVNDNICYRQGGLFVIKLDNAGQLANYVVYGFPSYGGEVQL